MSGADTRDSRPAGGEKVQKFLARAGVCSRRDAEELVAAGRVTVNGARAVIGQRVDPERDVVELDGRRVVPPEEFVYIMINKPAGVVTTAEDERGRTTVLDLVRRWLGRAAPRVFPVGRLDRNSTGLLLLTNDGELAYRLIHPRVGVAKVYRVEVRGHPSRRRLSELEQGIVLEGKRTLPCEIRVVRKLPRSTVLEVTLHEGRKRQIRLMMRAINHPVVSLERTALGPLKLGDLKRGSFRYLTKDEVAALERAVGLERDPA